MASRGDRIASSGNRPNLTRRGSIVAVALVVALPALLPLIGTPAVAQSPAIEEALRNSTFRPGAPFSFKTETTTTYLKTAATVAPGDPTGLPGVPNPDPPAPSTRFIFTHDLKKPTAETGLGGGDVPVQQNEHMILVGSIVETDDGDLRAVQVARFDPAPENLARDDVRLFAFQSTLYVSQRSDLSFIQSSPTDVRIRVYAVTGNGTRVDADNSTAALDPIATMALQPGATAVIGADRIGPGAPHTGPVTVFTGRLTLDSVDGFMLRRNQGLSFDVYSAGDTPFVLHLDQSVYPSSISFSSDSARIATWTQDLQGNVQTQFPKASIAATAERHVLVKAIHFNVWGNQECGDWNTTRAFQCPLDNLDQNQHRLRIQRFLENNVGGLTPGHFVNLDQGAIGNITVIGCCNAAGPIRYTPVGKAVGDFSFDFAYGANFQDGLYEVQVFQPTSTQNPWMSTARFRVGQVAFNLGPAPGERTDPADATRLLHEVLAGEPTHFTFRITNTGGASNVLSLTVPPPSTTGWTATLTDNEVRIAAGATQDVTVVVTPPSTAARGESVTVTLSALSVLDNAIKTFKAKTVVVTEVRPGVDLSTEVTTLEMRPGNRIFIPLTARNLGAARDTFVFSGSLTGNTTNTNCPDWTLIVEPSSLSLPSQSRSDLRVTLQAPPETRPGTACAILFKAQRVGDPDIRDTLPLPVRIFIVDSLTVTPLDDVIELRNKGQPICFNTNIRAPVEPPAGTPCAFPQVQDTEYDVSGILRLAVTNPGDRADTYQVRGSWVAQGALQTGNCEGDEGQGERDGVPDGWRWAAPPTGSLPANPQYGIGHSTEGNGDPGFSGDYFLGNVTVPAQATKYFFIELGHVDRTDPCADVGDGSAPPVQSPVSQTGQATFSPSARMRLTMRSQNDPTVTRVNVIGVDTIAAGRALAPNQYANDLRATLLELDPGVKAEGFTKAATTFRYALRAANLGNEKGPVTISMTPKYDNWAHRIVVRNADNQPIDIPCTPNDSSAVPRESVQCTMGVGDHVAFDVVVTAPAGTPIGTRHDVDVAAGIVSGNGTISKSLRLTTRVTGDYAFGLIRHAGSLQVARNDTVRFPFTIENLGTNGDEFRLSVLSGPAAWKPAVSLSSIFIPPAHRYTGFLEVTAPKDVPVTAPVLFQVQVRSNTGVKVDSLTLEAVPVLDPPQFGVVGDPKENLLVRGTPTQVKVVATDQTGKLRVNFTVDPVTLPPGWTVTPASVPNVPITANTASATFLVAAPTDALTQSRVPLRVTAQAGALSQATDVMLSLASTYGVRLKAATTNATIVAPGSSGDVAIEVQNTGLGTDTIQMTGVVGLPTGWRAEFIPTSLHLGALETGNLTVRIFAPSTALPGAKVAPVIFANSVGDATRGANLELAASVGAFRLVGRPAQSPLYAEPEAEVFQRVTIANNGTLPVKNLALRGVPENRFKDTLAPTFTTSAIDLLRPGESVETRMAFKLPPGLVPDDNVQVTIVATSTEPGQSSLLHQIPTTTVVLKHVAFDVDGDLVDEYAVDADRDATNGNEAFREPVSAGGVQTRCLSCTGTGVAGEPALAAFLSDDARRAKTVQFTLQNGTRITQLQYAFDGDDDGRADLLLDTDADGLPDVYWDPDSVVWQRLNQARADKKLVPLPRDASGDGAADYFIDASGDGLADDGLFTFESGTLDAVFDPSSGNVRDLLRIDADGDGVLDYVIDLNGNGLVDSGEFALLGGKLVGLQKVDVDGDRVLDCVFFSKDPGPNSFVPKCDARNRAVPIVLKDVTDDGRKDWTYDADGDGRTDSYYDPQGRATGLIDAQGAFVQALKEYWYVGLLFLVVTALFVVLLLVTRR